VCRNFEVRGSMSGSVVGAVLAATGWRLTVSTESIAATPDNLSRQQGATTSYCERVPTAAHRSTPSSTSSSLIAPGDVATQNRTHVGHCPQVRPIRTWAGARPDVLTAKARSIAIRG
jgi:hypothetical protein